MEARFFRSIFKLSFGPHRAVKCIIGILILWSTAYAYRNIIRAKDPYIYGDWLINYGSGFIRRGLAGEFLISIGSALSINLTYVVFFFVLTAIVLTHSLLYGLIRRSVDWLTIAVLVSPPGLLFLVINRGNVGRKEVIFLLFTLVAGFVFERFAAKEGRLPQALFVVCFFWLFATLAHEAAAFFFLPVLFLFVLRSIDKGAKSRGLLGAVFASFAVGMALLASVGTHRAEPSDVSVICGRLGDAAPKGCTEFDGAIGWLQRSSEYGIGTVISQFENGKLAELFVLGILLSLIYIAILALQFKIRPDIAEELPKILRLPLVHVLVFVGVTAPLYIVAFDWGRWLSIWFIQSVIYLLFCERMGLFDRVSGIAWGRQSNFVPVCLLVMSLVWSIPVCCVEARPVIAYMLDFVGVRIR